MNASEIIKSIEAEQLKAEVPEFAVGDTVKVHAKIKDMAFTFSKRGKDRSSKKR